MKITRLETILLTVPLTEPLRWSGGATTAISASLVRVHTDEGVTGLGESYTGIFAPKVARALAEEFEPYLVGEDPTDVARLFQKIYSKTLFWGRVGAGVSVLGGIESALWDITGKVQGVPVYKLLGGAVHSRLPVYASGGLEKPLNETLKEMQGYREMKLKAVKIRIGYGLPRDVEKVRQVREVLGPDIDLMVDAVQGHNPEPWPAKQAIQVGHAIEPYGIRWFEEPCAATDYTGYAMVRRELSMPISGGESSTTLYEFRHFFNASALDVVQPDTAHAGGILECRKIASLAQSHGVQVAFHSWSSSAILSPNYHLAFATSNCCYIEYPTWGFPLSDELFIEPLRIEGGYLYPPKTPGLGIELLEETIRRYPFREDMRLIMGRSQ